MYEGLSDRGKRVWQILEKGVKQGLNKTQIWNVLHDAGLSYRKSVLYRDIDVVSKALGKTEFQKRAPKSRIVDESFTIKTKTPTPKKFMATFRVTLLDRETGETFEKHFTVGTDYKQPLSYFEEQLYSSFNAPEITERYNAEIIETELDRVFGWW